MSKSVSLLSDVIAFSKYARYLPEKGRRENWNEIIYRNMEMHMRRFPAHALEIEETYDAVFDKQVLPSMRSAQFAGKPIELNPARIYNCAFMNAWRPEVFQESMFLLLGGTGVGFSVQRRHVRQLPVVVGPKERKRRHVIGDSIEGWADAVKVLTKAYFEGKSTPVFDFSDVRPKGALLVTSGGKAPGPEPLKECLKQLRAILDRAINRRLRSIEVHDMICHIAGAVLAGGIRRAALISLFSLDDKEMVRAKSGNWFETNPQRAYANNSAVIMRNQISEKAFKELWFEMQASGSGEPGIYLTNNADWGTNPCCEIALRDMQFCNLTEVNVSDLQSQDDLNHRVKAATILGTLQASYTDFHYLRPEWQDNCEREALLGVSMTGIASGAVEKLDLHQASEICRETNAEWAEKLGIRPAARLTCVKPSGTTSLVLGTSSGIHAWHHPHYIRRVRYKKNESIAQYMSTKFPSLVEQDIYDKSGDSIAVSFPIKAPEKAVFRTETALEFLTRVKRFSDEWVKPGHNSGDNTHNVSATVSIKPDEWEEVGDWMWDNRHVYNGLSILPYNGGTYEQPVYENITSDRFEELEGSIDGFNVDDIMELGDETDLTGEIACAGGACEIV